MASDATSPEEIPWHLGVHDAHCHPTDTPGSTLLPTKTATITAMATRPSDQSLVADLALKHKSTAPAIVPSFGHHPWFSHLIYDDLTTPEIPSAHAHYTLVLTPPPPEAFTSLLPAPTPMSAVLAQLRTHLHDFPDALVGEIGLDRAFRIPHPLPDARKYSPYKVTMEHQRRVFEAQLDVAGEYARAVSVHGVQCHGALFDVFEGLWKGYEVRMERKRDLKRRRRRTNPLSNEYEYIPDFGADSDSDSTPAPPPAGKRFPPRICLHSCSAPLQTLTQYLNHRGTPSQLFFSFSTTINKRDAKVDERIRVVPEECLLVESDLHTAGRELDAAMAEVVREVAVVKGWTLGETVVKVGRNWERFVG